jgi:hypothetical protein
MVQLAPDAFADASDFLDFYKKFAAENMDSLEHFLSMENDDARN